MSKAEEKSKQYRDFREQCGIKDPIMLDEIEEAYFEGYHQAEKDLELTWEDIPEIFRISEQLKTSWWFRDNEQTKKIGTQVFWEEVLKRFLETKNMKSIKEKLKRIVRWLNENYNQDSKNYSIFDGARPEVIKYDEHTAISFWACGAIICIESLIYFIREDDGYWFMREDENDCYAFQEIFSIGWAISLADALRRLVEYIEKNGKPVYYTGIEPKMICHYEL